MLLISDSGLRIEFDHLGDGATPFDLHRWQASLPLKVDKYDDEDQTPMSMKRSTGFINFIHSSAEDLFVQIITVFPIAFRIKSQRKSPTK